MTISLRTSSKSASEIAPSASIGSYKRSASALSVDSAKNELFPIKKAWNSSVSHQKRVRKPVQHVHFVVYEDETSSPDSYSSDSYRGSSPVYSAPQIGSVQSHISVELPFQSGIH